MSSTSLTINEILLSDSSCALLHSCARKFEFSKMYMIQKDERSLAGEVGKCMHIGVQHYFVNKNRETAIWEMTKNYPYDLCMEVRNDRSLEVCISTLERMLDKVDTLTYEIAQIKDREGNVKPAVEVPFIINITGFNFGKYGYLSVKYRGIIDLILYDTLAFFHKVFDIKTTYNQKIQDLTPRYHFAEQMVPYGIILEALLKNEIVGFGVNYLAAYLDIVDPKVHLYEFNKAQSDIEDWFKGILIDLNMIKLYLDQGWWRRDSKACMAFNRKCKYFDICDHRDPEVIQRILMPQDEQEAFDDKLIVSKTGKVFPDPWVEVELEIPK